MHAKGDRALEAEFPIDVIQKYIMAARHVNPAFTHESAELLREQYKLLRQNDSLHERNAYRITVRQLESLIRLSEAIARLNFDKYVRREYVAEACRLLKKSIIHVEKHDVEFDEDFSEAAMNVYRQEQAKLDKELREKEKESGPRKTTISFEEYDRMAKWIAMFLRQNEGEQGIKQQIIVDRYVEHHLDEITGREDTIRMIETVNGVIQRLITRDHILVIIEDNNDRSLRTLKVHWNYIP